MLDVEFVIAWTFQWLVTRHKERSGHSSSVESLQVKSDERPSNVTIITIVRNIIRETWFKKMLTITDLIMLNKILIIRRFFLCYSENLRISYSHIIVDDLQLFFFLVKASWYGMGKHFQRPQEKKIFISLRKQLNRKQPAVI